MFCYADNNDLSISTWLVVVHLSVCLMNKHLLVSQCLYLLWSGSWTWLVTASSFTSNHTSILDLKRWCDISCGSMVTLWLYSFPKMHISLSSMTQVLPSPQIVNLGEKSSSSTKVKIQDPQWHCASQLMLPSTHGSVPHYEWCLRITCYCDLLWQLKYLSLILTLTVRIPARGKHSSYLAYNYTGWLTQWMLLDFDLHRSNFM